VIIGHAAGAGLLVLGRGRLALVLLVHHDPLGDQAAEILAFAYGLGQAVQGSRTVKSGEDLGQNIRHGQNRVLVAGRIAQAVIDKDLPVLDVPAPPIGTGERDALACAWRPRFGFGKTA